MHLELGLVVSQIPLYVISGHNNIPATEAHEGWNASSYKACVAVECPEACLLGVHVPNDPMQHSPRDWPR